MAKILYFPGLDQGGIPDYTTIHILRPAQEMDLVGFAARFSATTPQSSHTALDGTFFDRNISSPFYPELPGSTVQT